MVWITENAIKKSATQYDNGKQILRKVETTFHEDEWKNYFITVATSVVYLLPDYYLSHRETKLWVRSADCFGKGGEIRDTKTLNLSRNIVSLQVLVDVSRFSPCLINLTATKAFVAG